MLSSIGTEISEPTPHTASAQPGDDRPAHLRRVRRQAADRAGLLQQLGRHQPGQQRLGCRVEDRHAGAGERLEQHHLPQPRMAGQVQDAERSLTERDHHVARDDHPLRREPVRDHAADQREDQRRRDLSREHIGQIGRRPGRVEDRE
jgi:hypothetical protein